MTEQEAFRDRLVSELRRRANLPEDAPDRAFIVGIRHLLGQAADALSDGGVSPTTPDERERLAYLLTAKRFHERGIQSQITDDDIEVARPMADYLIGEGLGFSRSREVTTEPTLRQEALRDLARDTPRSVTKEPQPITDADVEAAGRAIAAAQGVRYPGSMRDIWDRLARAALEAVEASRSPNESARITIVHEGGNSVTGTLDDVLNHGHLKPGWKYVPQPTDRYRDA